MPLISMVSPDSSHRPERKCPACSFCTNNVRDIDYKDYPLLKPHVDYFGNIRQRHRTGTCLRHQKMLKTAIERARFMGMLAYRK